MNLYSLFHNFRHKLKKFSRQSSAVSIQFLWCRLTQIYYEIKQRNFLVELRLEDKNLSENVGGIMRMCPERITF